MKQKAEKKSKDLSKMEDDMSTDVTRRNFLRSTGSAAALAGIAASGLVLSPGKVGATGLPKKWDEEVDVVVIGTGFSGTAAAIEAKMGGASVVVLEKMRVLGGNSAINGGIIACVGSKLQKKKGIKDSPDLLLKDMLKAGLGLNHRELVKIVAAKSGEVVEWSEDVLGVEYKPEVLQLGGHSVPRSLKTKEGTGAAFIKPALKKIRDLGIPIRTRVLASKLIVDESRRVVGIQVRERYKFPDPKSGLVKHIKARKGVIFATGGFGADVRFRSIEDPRLGSDVSCTNQPGATSDSLAELLRIGATPVQLSWIQSGPWASPKEKGVGVGALYNLRTFIHGILVDPATGKRFINELADRRIRAEAIFAVGHNCLTITDSEGIKTYAAYVEKALPKGIVQKFESLKDLAASYKMPLAEFKSQVDRYNAFVLSKDDKEFGKPIGAAVKPIQKAPFYVGLSWPKVHHCMGGVQINKNAQVIDLDGKIIPGLYAAGEATGGIHGACRLGSAAFLDCIVFGRVAGQNAAENKAWS